MNSGTDSQMVLGEYLGGGGSVQLDYKYTSL
jgi:hypothetical protein